MSHMFTAVNKGMSGQMGVLLGFLKEALVLGDTFVHRDGPNQSSSKLL